MKTKRNYKDSVFCCLFSDEDKLRELYNAITGSAYDSSTKIRINTLKGILYMDQVNDISFTIGDKLVILIEHQASINPNMPLRFLLYITQVFEIIINHLTQGTTPPRYATRKQRKLAAANKAIYSETLLKIPEPEFIVLYNGDKPFPDKHTYYLSTAFEKTPADHPKLNLEVTVYNVNKGHNEWLTKRSKTLDEYSIFIAKARQYHRYLSRNRAIKKAVTYCKKNGIMVDFLNEHALEVMKMLTKEWDWDVAKSVWKEESLAEGIQIGET
jgi:hypothetical protein